MKRKEVIEAGYRRLKELQEKEIGSFYDRGQIQGYILALDSLEAEKPLRESRSRIDANLNFAITNPRPPEHWLMEFANTPRNNDGYVMGYVHALQIMRLLLRKDPS